MSCTIDLTNWGLEERSHQIFYATHDSILYKMGQYIYLSDCGDNVISSTICPFDSMRFSVLEYPDCIVLLIGGRDIIVFDKNGFKLIKHKFDVQKYGRIVTDLFPSNGNNVIFGTVLKDQSQLVIYDFVDGIRTGQSPSWKANRIDKLVVDERTAYGLLSKSFFVACDIRTGENVAKRFDSGITESNIKSVNGDLYYVSEGRLKRYHNSKTDIYSVPGVEVSDICGVKSNQIYLTYQNATGICCYNLTENRIEWQIDGQVPIKESLHLKGKTIAGIVDALVCRTLSGIIGIDLSAGRAVQHHQIYGSYKLHQSKDHVILNCANEFTLLLPGVV